MYGFCPAICRKRTSAPADRGASLAVYLAIVLLLFARWTRAADPPHRARPPEFPAEVRELFVPDPARLVGPRPAETMRDRIVPARPAMADRADDGLPWSQWIEPETLEGEIKRQAIALKGALASSARFKGGDFQQAALALEMLAVCFGMLKDHSEGRRWKPEAADMRDLMFAGSRQCQEPSDEAFRLARERSEALEQLIRGEQPPLHAARPDSDWMRQVSRPQLMLRLDQATAGSLSEATADAAAFARGRDRLGQEAQIVSALARLLECVDDPRAQEAEYLRHSRQLHEDSTKARAAAQRGDLAAAREAAGGISRACSACHDAYRN